MRTKPGGLTPAATRVLAVASDLFYTRGINTVGMELIAEEASVTKKTIYDRFGSKENLVVAYLRARDERWRHWLLDRLNQFDNPRDRVLHTFDALGEWMGETSTHGCAMVNAFAELTDPGHPGRLVVTSQKEWTHTLYRDLARELGTANPDAVAETLLVLHEGAVITHAVVGRADATETARRAAERLLPEGAS
ncbi:TetR/AcrR family transcriptional regulator [Spiractinospora alimapuensis]|uniref:TetR/AcrR family transcriptional regulator n=1 Tax=Spiractinospora alimapuensis TaxID=2820884 RepID=UPI001F215CAB|nr:TetR/AcrR family transcriptional regulator [Spiractinospora alimapuensis]QVQ50007.1 TetR/AcrR family transcriptional regulator [Spiractinospora alimapuensis]